ncbi:MAG: hypothetical protein K2K56_11660 [Lachnospiraceae bacterium]|nr:hypothetical protein [Lachnospiraceae bacterium]
MGNNVLGRLIFALIGIGAVLSFMGARDFIYSRKTPEDFNAMTEADFEKGILVEGDLYANLGAFEENYTTRNGIKTGDSKYNYMIAVGEKQYMGLLNLNSSQESELNAQADATYAYMMGETDTSPTPVHFKGRVMKMSGETKGYLQDYMRDIGFTDSEINSLILEYYIKCDNYDGWGWELMVGVVCLFIGIAIVVIPVISERRKNQVVFANGPSDRQESVVRNDADTYQPETRSAFGDMDLGSEVHSAADGLGMGVADDYKPETDNQSGHSSLRLKDD